MQFLGGHRKAKGRRNDVSAPVLTIQTFLPFAVTALPGRDKDQSNTMAEGGRGSGFPLPGYQFEGVCMDQMTKVYYIKEHDKTR